MKLLSSKVPILPEEGKNDCIVFMSGQTRVYFLKDKEIMLIVPYCVSGPGLVEFIDHTFSLSSERLVLEQKN